MTDTRPRIDDDDERLEIDLVGRVRNMVLWLRQGITEPRRNLDDAQRRVRNSVEVFQFARRHFRQVRAPEMAAALAFRTLFGMIPVLIVATIGARAVLGTSFDERVNALVETLGLDELEMSGEPDGQTPPTAALGGDVADGTIGAPAPDASASSDPGAATSASTDVADVEPQDLGNWVRELISEASAINLSALGAVGVSVMLFSAIWVMVGIENAFNLICRAPKGRAWTRRVLVYWFVLTFGPVALGLMPWAWSSITSIAAQLPDWAWLTWTTQTVGSVLLFYLFLLVVYRSVPNARVKIQAASTGALVGAILLEAGKQGLGVYFKNAFTVNRLYGSLGFVPVFMFWTYLMWMSVLLGLEVASIIQAVQGRLAGPLPETIDEESPLVDPATILAVSERIVERFAEGSAVTIDELARETGVGLDPIVLMLDKLQDLGVIHRVADAPGWTLSLPPERVSAVRILDAGFELADERMSHPPTAAMLRLREAQRAEAARIVVRSSSEPTDAPAPRSDEADRPAAPTPDPTVG